MAADGFLLSARLTLRQLVVEDAASFARLLGPDRDALRQMAEMPDPCTEDAARTWIERRIGPGGHVCAIIHRDDAAFIGVVGFGGGPEMPELGYWIGAAYRGQGYATEAVRRLLEHAAAIGIFRLHADVFRDNPASARVLSKAGFGRAGTVRRRFTRGTRTLVRYLWPAEHAEG